MAKCKHFEAEVNQREYGRRWVRESWVLKHGKKSVLVQSGVQDIAHQCL